MLWPFPNSFRRCCLLLAAAFAVGCGQEAIKVYTIAKETPPATMEAPATAPQLTWTTPEGWQEQPPGQLRVASFKVAGPDGKPADVSVIPLGGAAGSDLSNVNRWRNQVGLAPVAEAEIKQLAEPVTVSGQPAALYDLAGSPNRILAAIQRRGDRAWFFKMTGDSALVAQQKPAFIAFLESFQFAADEAPAPSAGPPQWTAPSDWKEVPGGQFLVAKFLLTGSGDATAAVNVSSAAGDGGGLGANVNRWRKQLGLAAMTGEELAKSAKPVTMPSGRAMLVELSGNDPQTGHPVQLVAVIVLQPGQAWFYKLMGDATVVAPQKDAFLKFVQEVKY